MSIKWMTAVLDHSPYKGSALLVQLILADWANEDGECYPHLPTLIKRTRVSRPVVYRVLAQMKADGYLSYEGESLSKPSREIPFRLHRAWVRVSDRDDPVSNRDEVVSNRDAEADHTSSIRTIKEPSSTRARAVTDVTSDDGFDYWWTQYPEGKRVGKVPARAAYGRARKKVDAELLLRAVQDYADSRRGKDKTYTLNPTTWLNQERWDDEAPPTRIGVLPDAPMPDWMKKIAKEQP